MTARTVLNLHLVVDDAKVSECAKALRARLPPDQWKLLAQLAAEIVAAWETAAAGQRILVVPAAEKEAELHRALRLVPAGRE